MDTLVQSGPQLDLDYRIDAFEEARRLNPKTDLSWFLPPREHPGYLTALGELIRVEMDRDWADGKPRSLREYCRRYPEVAGNPEVLRNVAFEEYRLRRQTGESIRPQEYAAEFQVDIAAWPLLPPRPGELEAAGVAEAARSSWADSVESAAGHDQVLREFERAEPDSAKRWANAVHGIPPAGSEFLGFRLLEELGRGAFGRVFLAQQGDLADRPVALKVATDIFQESQTLAQLQHANIVPIYSFHKAGALQAVCMPYFGSTTLGHVLQHIQGQAGLPTSGRDLISTVNGRRSITRDSQLPSNRSAGSAPAPLTPIEEPAAPAAAAIFAPASETWKRLEALSFTDAVLWLAARVTDGLAHAHEHGVLHRDLKPANILLTNDGQPMLLDFNLSAPGGVRANAAAARVGGTLPYMAPEHMQAFRGGQVQPDERSDIYSLGVILYTLLAGRNPFPAYKGRMRDIVDLMFQDRCRNAPRLRPLNPSVSPALEAIVLRCLDPDPAKRYQTARHLHEDLELQLAHRPLKHTPEPSRLERLAKWRKRHPRLTSAGSVAALAAALLIGVVAAAAAGREEYRTLHAREQLAAHQSEFGSIQVQLDRRDPSKETLDDGIERSKGELARYGISPNDPAPSWDQATEVRYLSTAERIRLADDVGELFFLMAKAAALKAERAADQPAERDTWLCSAERWNGLAESFNGDRLPRALLQQRADLLLSKGAAEESRRLRDRLGLMEPKTPRDSYLLGHWLVKQGRLREALPHLRRATLEDPESFSAWFVRGNTHLELNQPEMAAVCFSTCIGLRRHVPEAWMNRGLAYSQMRFYRDALDDYNQAVGLNPDGAEAYYQRSEVYQALGQWQNVVDDLNRAEEHGLCPGIVCFRRANAKAQLGDRDGAAADRERGLREKPTDARGWVMLAEHRVEQDAKLALADIEQALKLNPSSMYGLQMKAHILAERLNRGGEAVAVLDRAVELYPDFAPARVGRGVLLARQGKRAEAVRDAEEALILDAKAPNLYQVACIYALTSRQQSDDRLQVIRLLAPALRQGFGVDIVDSDPDLEPVRQLPEFQRIVAAAKERQRDEARAN